MLKRKTKLQVHEVKLSTLLLIFIRILVAFKLNQQNIFNSFRRSVFYFFFSRRYNINLNVNSACKLVRKDLK